MLLIFGDCTLDPDRRELTRGGGAVSVGPQVFDLLLCLIENRQRVVSKDDLLEIVWRGRIVSESTIASHINAARTAIGDSGQEQKFIRTVTRKGLRFVGAVTEVLSNADQIGASVSQSPQPSNVLPFLTPQGGDVAYASIENIVASSPRGLCLFVIALFPSALTPDVNVGLRDVSGAPHAAVGAI